MKLHTLKPAAGSTHKDKRLGRGEASGKGGTSTQGNKGGQSRAGYSRKNGFEGGQMPIQRRIPKRGFKNNNKIVYSVFNLGRIEELYQKYQFELFSTEELFANGLIGKTHKVKVLGDGELKTKINFKVNAISEKAKSEIEKLGCTIELIK